MNAQNAPRSAPQPRYALWNNKGGVGKTFLSFVVAAEYAAVHPETMVVVVDMCPQANVSEILLGGNGAGAKALAGLLARTPRQSIGGYFDQRITSPHAKTGTEATFVCDPTRANSNLPKNMRLVAGDPSLEVQTQAMNQIAAQTLPPGAWKSVHYWLKDLIDGIAIQHPNAVFFIDCNPSFSAYTEVALCAANRVIVPCTADGSSARAIDNIGQLLYGIGVPAGYVGANFASLAATHNVGVPSIHMVPLNRSTQYDQSASKAFGAMYDEIQARVRALHGQRPANFSVPPSAKLFVDVPDVHSTCVVASHHGIPLSVLRAGAYDVHGERTQVNPGPLQRYRTAIAALVGLL